MGRVESIRFVYAPQLMYNLSVAEAHTYFVGEGQWLVHNQKGCTFWLSGDYIKVAQRNLPSDGGPSWGAIGRYSDNGQLRQIGLYDGDGNVIYHIDAPDSTTPSWHYHEFPAPGNPHVGHGTDSAHHKIPDLNKFLEDIGFDTDDWMTGP